MINPEIDIIATTISGSMKDWGKIEKIVPLFNEKGFTNVNLFTLDSHSKVREQAFESIRNGRRMIISAGGSGTFNAVLEGCCDSGINLDEITMGFLRKGSADLIGKTLGMPDNINEAIEVFVESIKLKKTVPCDVIMVESEKEGSKVCHFVGYAGAGIFGEIPYFTENRFTKYYKGVLGTILGDLGPFFIGASLACIRKYIRNIFIRKNKWKIFVDGFETAENYYQTFIIVNGDLGKDLPLAKDIPLGSGDFYLFAIKDIGLFKLAGQFKHTWDASVLINPEKWGFEKYQIKNLLKLQPDNLNDFDSNIDGSTMVCRKSVTFKICDQINLISRI
ncbi:diacylglycerol/lipid kinase family protein [candidate division KSB1 bacterium]